MTDFLTLAAEQKQKAFDIIDQSGIVQVWKKNGARVNLVGSLKIGVLAKHRDIDFHVYTQTLDVKKSFEIMAEICHCLKIRKCEFTNLADTDEHCFEWHLWFDDDDEKLWQIDIIQILSGSFYDGYFERTADAVCAAMSEDMRQTIIRLKYETPDEMKIAGMEYYKAVIQDSVTTFDDFLKWRETHRFDGIIEW